MPTCYRSQGVAALHSIVYSLRRRAAVAPRLGARGLGDDRLVDDGLGGLHLLACHSVDGVLHVDEARNVAQRQAQGRRLRQSRHHVAAVDGVEGAYHVDVDVAHCSHLREVDVAVNHHGVGLGRQLATHRADAVLAVVRHGVVGCYECRHVAARLLWQVGVYLPVVALASRAANGTVDVLRPAVIGGNDEVPVAKDKIEVAQIARCGIRRLDGVAAVVGQRCHLKPVGLARGEHELPEPRGTYARHGRGVQRRLYDGQVLKLERQLIGIERLLEDGHVEVCGTKHIAHLTAQAHHVAVDARAHHVVVVHIHYHGHAPQAVGILLVADGGVGAERLAVAGLRQVCLRHPQVHQAVEVGIGKGLGEVEAVAYVVGIYHFHFVHVGLIALVGHYLCRSRQWQQRQQKYVCTFHNICKFSVV